MTAVRQLVRQLRTALLSCALLVGCVGCERKKPLIYVIPRTTATLFWESVHSGTLSAAQTSGFRIYWNAATREDDIGRQIALIQQAGSRRPVGLVLAPSHAAALLTEVRKLVAQGMPMVVIESRLSLPSGPNLTYIVSDHARAGHVIASKIGTLEQRPRVAIVGIDADIPSNLETMSGTLTGLAEQPHAKITEKRFSRFNRQQTEEQVESFLDSDPDVNVIVALSPPATAGALDALHRRPKRSRRVHIIGCDQDLSLLPFLSSGEIDALVLQDTYQQGYLAVQAIAEHQRSGHWPAEIVTMSRLITAADLTDPAVRNAFIMSPER